MCSGEAIYINFQKRGGSCKILHLKLFQVAVTTVLILLLAERQEKHTEDSGCSFKLHQEDHGVCVLFLQAWIFPLWIRSDGLEWLQELSANIYTAAWSDSSNLSGMLWQFLAAAMRTRGHASMKGFKVETWILNRKRHPDWIIFCRIGRKHSAIKALTASWRFCTLPYFLGHSDATVFSCYIGTAAFRWTKPVFQLSGKVTKQVTWLHLGTCTWVQWLKKKSRQSIYLLVL